VTCIISAILGQFVNGQKHVILKNEHDQPISGKHMAKFQVREGPAFLATQLQTPIKRQHRHVIHAQLIERSEVISKETEKCWMVHKAYKELLTGPRESYVVTDFISQ